MTAEQIDIADMQCWLFRMAQIRWGLSASDCADLFEGHDILGFIERNYGLLHLSSYECALDEVATYLRNEGVRLTC